MAASLLQGCIFSVPGSISQKDYSQYYETWIKPHLTLAYNHPVIPFFFYISGIVFETFDKTHKECQAVLQELIKRKQIELLGGLYYDAAPILQATKDQRDQIEKLNYYIKKHYQILPRGVWVTPGTFDNASISVFKNIGQEYLMAERAYIESVLPYSTFGFIEEKGEVLPVHVYDKTLVQKLQNAGKAMDVIEKLTDDLIKRAAPSQILCAEYHDVADKDAYFQTLERLQIMVEQKNAAQYCTFPHDEHRGALKIKSSLCRIRTTAYGGEENETFVKQILYRPESRLLYGLLQYCTRTVEKYKKDKTVKQSAKTMLMEAQNHFLFGLLTGHGEFKLWRFDKMHIEQSHL